VVPNPRISAGSTVGITGSVSASTRVYSEEEEEEEEEAADM
jgi:hypothetical protein